MLLVANSTPMVGICLRLNLLRVKHDRRSDLPTPESPTSTTRAGGGREGGERKGEMEGEEVGRGRK